MAEALAVGMRVVLLNPEGTIQPGWSGTIVCITDIFGEPTPDDLVVIADDVGEHLVKFRREVVVFNAA